MVEAAIIKGMDGNSQDCRDQKKLGRTRTRKKIAADLFFLSFLLAWSFFRLRPGHAGDQLFVCLFGGHLFSAARVVAVGMIAGAGSAAGLEHLIAHHRDHGMAGATFASRTVIVYVVAEAHRDSLNKTNNKRTFSPSITATMNSTIAVIARDPVIARDRKRPEHCLYSDHRITRSSDHRMPSRRFQLGREMSEERRA
jgi:hypothetical protein